MCLAARRFGEEKAPPKRGDNKSDMKDPKRSWRAGSVLWVGGWQLDGSPSVLAVELSSPRRFFVKLKIQPQSINQSPINPHLCCPEELRSTQGSLLKSFQWTMAAKSSFTGKSIDRQYRGRGRFIRTDSSSPHSITRYHSGVIYCTLGVAWCNQSADTALDHLLMAQA